ncbi:hypothetical protein BGX24_010581 [Mortierella sp. AD032]|nr:hypothetical protein BGX24_010581 [Mortierella sp. AD032]
MIDVPAFGGAGSYLFFTNRDLRVSLTPLTSGQALWYYVAAVSVLATAVGLLGMVSALIAHRRMVKTFEAFYVLSLLTQFALTAWALVWCKQNQSQFDTICSASKSGLVSLPLPSFMNDWTCQKIFMALILTIGIGGLVWIFFNFYMTNRVIHYARELFAERADRYKVLGEAATKELDREQQIPLNYTNVGRSMPAEEEGEGFQNSHAQQPSYRDEIEYKDPRGNSNFQAPRATAAGFGAFDQAAAPQHQLQQGYHAQQPPAAPGFNYRDSTQDLFNPYHSHGEQEHIPVPPPASSSSASASAFAAIPPPPPGPTSPSSTAKIASPFDDDEPVAGFGLTPLTTSTSHDDIKVPLPASPRDGDVLSPTSPTNRKSPPSNIL